MRGQYDNGAWHNYACQCSECIERPRTGAHEFGDHANCSWCCDEFAKIKVRELPKSTQKSAWDFYCKNGSLTNEQLEFFKNKGE